MAGAGLHLYLEEKGLENLLRRRLSLTTNFMNAYTAYRDRKASILMSNGLASQYLTRTL